MAKIPLDGDNGPKYRRNPAHIGDQYIKGDQFFVVERLVGFTGVIFEHSHVTYRLKDDGDVAEPPRATCGYLSDRRAFRLTGERLTEHKRKNALRDARLIIGNEASRLNRLVNFGTDDEVMSAKGEIDYMRVLRDTMPEGSK